MLMSQKDTLQYVLTRLLFINELANVYQHAIESTRQQRVCRRQLATALIFACIV